jgi:aldehyde dehydrogenase (NAD+)
MDIPALVGVFNYFAGSGYHVLGESSLSSPNFLNVSVRQPYGVVGLIIPWNVRDVYVRAYVCSKRGKGVVSP